MLQPVDGHCEKTLFVSTLSHPVISRKIFNSFMKTIGHESWRVAAAAEAVFR